MTNQKKIVIIEQNHVTGRRSKFMSIVQTLPSVSRLADTDMQAVPAALARAAQRAREIAAQTGTPLIVVRDGKLIEEMVTADTMPVGAYNQD